MISLQVNIIVSDVNDVVPEFVSFMEVTVAENTAVDTSVFKVIAKDTDEGRNGDLEYSLSGSSRFVMESDSGVLRVSGALDRERVDRYVVNVTATDKGHPRLSTTQRLVIRIGDANDNDPVVEPSVYSATLTEDTPVGMSILKVTASDADLGLNAELQYTIVTGDDDSYFYMDVHTGVLSVGRRLDYERTTSYVLNVQVRDFGAPSRGGFAEVRVTITDVNDCTPTFYDSPYVARVQENADTLPVFVTRMTATDGDSLPNSHVTYSILDGDRSIFDINSTTGVITAMKSFDREQRVRYQLVITGSDSGRSTRTNSNKSPFPWLFPSCRVAGMTADLPSPHRPVRLLARSQSSTFHVSLARVFPSYFRLSYLSFPRYICSQHFPQY